MVPALAKVSVTGTVSFSTSGSLSPMIMRWSPPGSSVTVPPAGTGMPSGSSLIFITSPSIFIS